MIKPIITVVHGVVYKTGPYQSEGGGWWYGRMNQDGTMTLMKKKDYDFALAPTRPYQPPPLDPPPF